MASIRDRVSLPRKEPVSWGGNGARARLRLTRLCKALPRLDHCFSVFQMQAVSLQAHGKDRCSDPLCFWCVSRALPHPRWRYPWALARPGKGKSEGSGTDYVTLGQTLPL